MKKVPSTQRRNHGRDHDNKERFGNDDKYDDNDDDEYAPSWWEERFFSPYAPSSRRCSYLSSSSPSPSPPSSSPFSFRWTCPSDDAKMMRTSSNNENINFAIHAYASALQTYLGIVVTPCLFAPAGRADVLCSCHPSSLVTVEPFVPGGMRRLALNVRSSLVGDVATAFVSSSSSSSSSLSLSSKMASTLFQAGSDADENDTNDGGRDGFSPGRSFLRRKDQRTRRKRRRRRQGKQQREGRFSERDAAVAKAALDMGAAMVHSGTWPIENDFDLSGKTVVQWKMAPGLICGPSSSSHLYVWPVPHDTNNVRLPTVQQSFGTYLSSAQQTLPSSSSPPPLPPGMEVIAIWPKRIIFRREVCDSRRAFVHVASSVGDDGDKDKDNGAGDDIDDNHDGNTRRRHQQRYETIQVGDRWMRREEKLEMEWSAFLREAACRSRPCPCRFCRCRCDCGRCRHCRRGCALTPTPTPLSSIPSRSNRKSRWRWCSMSPFPSDSDCDCDCDCDCDSIPSSSRPCPRPHPSQPAPLNRQALVTYAPELPILALADEMRCYNTYYRGTSSRGMPRTFAIPAAASALLTTDRMFGLSLFFGVPMIDRTGVLAMERYDDDDEYDEYNNDDEYDDDAYDEYDRGNDEGGAKGGKGVGKRRGGGGGGGILRTYVASPPPPSPKEVEEYRRRIFAGATGWDDATASWKENEEKNEDEEREEEEQKEKGGISDVENAARKDIAAAESVGGVRGVVKKKNRLGGEAADEICRRELESEMMRRARALWEEADGGLGVIGGGGESKGGRGKGGGNGDRNASMSQSSPSSFAAGTVVVPPKEIRVMWSGGIDSTAVLIGLVRAANIMDEEEDKNKNKNKRNNSSNKKDESSSTLSLLTSLDNNVQIHGRRRDNCAGESSNREGGRGGGEVKDGAAPSSSPRRVRRLIVVLDDESRSEYPWFYERHIKGQPFLREEERDGRSISAIAAAAAAATQGGSLTVTGELGDQLFGSDKCAAAFPDNDDDDNDNCDEKEEVGVAKEFKFDPHLSIKDVTVGGGSGSCLADPWTKTLLPALYEAGLIGGGGGGGGNEDYASASASWEAWIAPQLRTAPFPIVSTHDMLWWLNFSCKWQGVALRCAHDGGIPFAPRVIGGVGVGDAEEPSDVVALSNDEDDGDGGGGGGGGGAISVAEPSRSLSSFLGGVRHFYEDRDLEKLACVREFHARKFGDLTQWHTYKEPLKRFIYDFTGDDDYYRNKLKVGSLCFGVEGERQNPEYVSAMLGLIVEDSVADCHGRIVKDGIRSTGEALSAAASVTTRYLQWGACSLREGDGLRALLRADFVASLRGPGTGAQREVMVDPWPALGSVSASGASASTAAAAAAKQVNRKQDDDHHYDCNDGKKDDEIGPVDAFEVRAPRFASSDERQRRVFNPVTAITLVGKCAALLPPKLVRGRTVLDLGACLGAMCHWVLCAGAARAVAVEVQRDFCLRAAELLKAAEHTWPPSPRPSLSSSAASSSKVVPGMEGRRKKEGRYEVIWSGVREFLAGCEDGAFDVVVGAGILQCFVDPIEIFLQMCRVARVAVVVEVDQPGVVQVGVHADEVARNPPQPTATGTAAVFPSRSLAQGARPAPYVAERAALLQLAPSALVNRSGREDSSYVGLGVVPSRASLEATASAMGFVPTRIRLAPHPTRDADVRTYTGLRKFQAVPRRFFLRCERHPRPLPRPFRDDEAMKTTENKKMKEEAMRCGRMPHSLEAAVTSGTGNRVLWKDARTWWKFGGEGASTPAVTSPSEMLPDDEKKERKEEDVAAVESKIVHSQVNPAEATVVVETLEVAKPAGVKPSTMKMVPELLTAWSDKSTDPKPAPPGMWSFDANVADRFEREAYCHIPDYAKVVELAVDAAEASLLAAGLDPKRHSIIDVGCATGYTMNFLLRKGSFSSVHGVDSSPPMIARCRANLVAAGQEVSNAECCVHEAAVFPPASMLNPPLGAVMANWTLHFIVSAAEREAYLRAVFDALEPGGVLVLTEKTSQDAVSRKLYHAWKAQRGVSAAEIEAKEKALQGVLVPFSTKWYAAALRRSGFVGLEVLWERFGFVTWVASKPLLSARALVATDISGPSTSTLDAINSPLFWPNFANTIVTDGSLADGGSDAVSYDAMHDFTAPFSFTAWGTAASDTERCWRNNDDILSAYGYVVVGPATLRRLGGRGGGGFTCTLVSGMYFSFPGRCEVSGGAGVIALAPDGPGGSHRALFAVGGPVEAGKNGRLPYIDGCTDTLLLAPPRLGAPCLNHLHFPPSVTQTRHTHPSGRVGVVIAGEGVCVLDDADADASPESGSDNDGVVRRVPLRAGTAFVIPAGAPHAFETLVGSDLDVVAFHPDSDFGPTPTDHPMVNRTVVNGVSASQRHDIRTSNLE